MSLQLAHEHQRLSQTEAACEALAQSLDYYRLALAKETGATYGEIARSRADDEGMQEIRARFGCSARQLS